MLSTHWRVPHQLRVGDFELLDVLARQAAYLIERNLPLRSRLPNSAWL